MACVPLSEAKDGLQRPETAKGEKKEIEEATGGELKRGEDKRWYR